MVKVVATVADEVEFLRSLGIEVQPGVMDLKMNTGETRPVRLYFAEVDLNALPFATNIPFIAERLTIDDQPTQWVMLTSVEMFVESTEESSHMIQMDLHERLSRS